MFVTLLGTMSGGGGKVTKGRMSSRIHDDISPQQLTEMESSLNRKEKEFEVHILSNLGEANHLG